MGGRWDRGMSPAARCVTWRRPPPGHSAIRTLRRHPDPSRPRRRGCHSPEHASFDNGWTGIALAIFGLHLFGLGALVFRSADFPRFLGVLGVIAGGGYLADSPTSELLPKSGVPARHHDGSELRTPRRQSGL
ncbi:MAG: hypothetical protein DLM71_04835 [Chloroflexi bacterium]|nr:MAG: hypothetical protein DLM71_04835 [Chloroflexota bacterium]